LEIVTNNSILQIEKLIILLLFILIFMSFAEKNQLIKLLFSVLLMLFVLHAESSEWICIQRQANDHSVCQGSLIYWNRRIVFQIVFKNHVILHCSFLDDMHNYRLLMMHSLLNDWKRTLRYQHSRIFMCILLGCLLRCSDEKLDGIGI
jgi:hypothetical protein